MHGEVVRESEHLAVAHEQAASGHEHEARGTAAVAGARDDPVASHRQLGRNADAPHDARAQFVQLSADAPADHGAIADLAGGPAGRLQDERPLVGSGHQRGQRLGDVDRQRDERSDAKRHLLFGERGCLLHTRYASAAPAKMRIPRRRVRQFRDGAAASLPFRTRGRPGRRGSPRPRLRRRPQTRTHAFRSRPHARPRQPIRRPRSPTRNRNPRGPPSRPRKHPNPCPRPRSSRRSPRLERSPRLLRRRSRTCRPDSPGSSRPLLSIKLRTARTGSGPNSWGLTPGVRV